MKRKELLSRWNQGSGASARTMIVRALQKHEPVAGLTPFETVDSRADLRGFAAGALRSVRGVELSYVDLS